MKLECTNANKFRAPVEVGDVAQIHPGVDDAGGWFMIVTKLLVGACEGYVTVPIDAGLPKKLIYRTVRYDALQKIGHAEWVIDMGIPKT